MDQSLELEKVLADESVAPTDLPLWFLKAITQDFSDSRLIASGGFGSVYKGVLRNGMVVAVKKLHNKIEVQEKDFQREVACLIKVKHKNIVRCLGYSYETQHIIYEYQGRHVLADKPNMLFCFEYLSKGSLANYITDASSGLEWRVRYQIIKGICEGVAHLHERCIIHRDLKPENILLDDTMVPKITDFGISRCFSGNQYKTITENIVGSLGYMPPEFLRSGTITLGTDIYSLGVIITEIVTGNKECPNINMVLESWTNTFGTSKSNPPLEQVKLCAEIGIDCLHDDPSGRPDIQDIICRLNKTDISELVVSVTRTVNAQLGRFYQYYRQAKQICKPMRITVSMVPELPSCSLSESALLDVHPLELCFCFKAKKDSHCSLSLINRTDRYFAYFIRPQFQDMYTIDQPISYHLYPMSSLVLNVKMVEQELQPLDMGMFEILMVNMKSMSDLEKLKLSIGNDLQKIDDDLLKRVEELDGEVHAAVLKAVIYRPRDDDLKPSMELAFGAMAGLAPKLSELLMAEYVMEKGLKPNIESLSNELVMMKSSLEDSSQVPPGQLSEVEKQWAWQVRELSYDIEDDVDDFILHMAGGVKSAAAAIDTEVFEKILGKATATMKKFKDRCQICDKVKDMKKLSNELAELRTKYTVRGMGADLAATTGIDPRVRNHLVGIEESRDKVIRMLSIGTNEDAHAHASDQNLKIVSIVGIGGLGKTTLAKTVHDMLKKQFGCSAFISVGRTASLTRAFEKMLVDLDEKYSQVDMSRWDEERFSNELHKFLQHKRYIIVVDDIWDVESWEGVRYALRDNNCGSRMIMTTRNVEVATKVEEVYRLKPLSDGNSKKLFYKRIQSQEGESLGVWGEFPSKIIDKCGGIPLAIIAIASLLVERLSEDWSKVYDSIGFGNGDNTTKILSYSYYDLPSYLKPCILYLSKFQEDSIIDTKAVIWMWIGEGFVHLEKEEDSLFEVGQRYFNELVNRSWIQPMDDTYNWFTQYFRIHDIVFDFIRKLSGVENFITVLDSREQHTSPDSLRNLKKTGMPSLDSKVRRLAVLNPHEQCFPEDAVDMPKVLRSLSIEDSKIEIMTPLHRFRVCRVLNLQDCHVPISLKHIGRLLHLKYLDISFTAVDELPKELGHLKSLLALILINIGLDELPPTVCSLTQLMCLVAQGFKSFPANRMGNLTSLEELRLKTIVGWSTTGDLVVELGKLMRLRVVRIRFLKELKESMQKALVQSLCILHELQELVLFSTGLSQQGATVWEEWVAPRQLRRLVIVGIRFSRLLGWINRSCLPRLCYLSLKVAVVEVQDLDNLARLPELRYLALVGSSWPPGYTVGTEDFRNLRLCQMGTALKFHMGAMPRLEELQFGVYAGHFSWEENGVPLEQFPTKEEIEDLDFGLDNLVSLEQVTVVVDCSGATAAEVQEVEAVVTRAVENHPNRPTIQMHRECEGNIFSDEKQEQRLQRNIKEHLDVLDYKDDETDARFISYLWRYRHLQKAVISIDCAGASMCEVEKVEAALRHAAEVHPNHPTIQLIRTNTHEMVYSSDHSDTEQDDYKHWKSSSDLWFSA